MFERYNDSLNNEDHEPMKEFPHNILKQSIPLLRSNLKITSTVKSNFIGTTTLKYAIRVISSSTHIDSAMEKLKPLVEKLVYLVILPCLMLTKG